MFYFKVSDQTEDPSYLQKSADFIKAFTLGFDIPDAISLLRLDDLYVESFEVKDGSWMVEFTVNFSQNVIGGPFGKSYRPYRRQRWQDSVYD